MLPNNPLPLLVALAFLSMPLQAAEVPPVGHAAGGGWKVHDMSRPQPTVVTPAPPGDPVPAPSDALILFAGTDLAAWNGTATIEGGALTLAGSELTTKESFGDCQLHLEWAAPVPATGAGQGRGNSGVFLMSRYEVQVLDCFENQTYPDGQAGALYGMFPPLVNACRAPGAWQTYDILWKAPRFNAEQLVAPGVVTVLHNGVAIHVAQEVLGTSTAGAATPYRAHGDAPLRLQWHGNPVRYRNIWIRRVDFTPVAKPL
jgi:Domain of Unknown Function (DUF1080)